MADGAMSDVLHGAVEVGDAADSVRLAVVMPVLGHATWHLYRRVVG